jgi:hypothetical protein
MPRALRYFGASARSQDAVRKLDLKMTGRHNRTLLVVRSHLRSRSRSWIGNAAEVETSIMTGVAALAFVYD